ncbi:glycosyltransferase [Podospora aff. communis PSN243]|uniref:Glycosyltransferase n=1 Tax=Podospora aff. communis PSN243 TaxID=3040156 RepID=A0AAV9G525_9PEZI|nr:glycosyltransferase [Podospora aff. communis PSN243]
MPAASKFTTITALLIISLFLFLYNSFGLRGLAATSGLGGRPSAAVPKKLWYKLGPKGLSDNSREWTNSCIQNNKDYVANFMTDESADAYVRERYGALRPDLVEIYLGISVPILKADMFRYLVLYAEGGVYCDLDVSCDAPIDQWIPQQYKDDASVVVGWEFDVGWGDRFVRQFTTWTIMAKPGSPHIWAVVEDILRGLRETMRAKDVPVEKLTREIVGDIVDATGPRRFTRSTLKSVGETFNTTVDGITELWEPKLIGDVLILPGYAFAASANKYGEGVAVPSPLVTHHYAGTWKNEHGGEMS